MSVIKRKGSPYYHLDFQIKGVRFCGSTRCTNRREAEAVERAEKEKARALTKLRPDDASRSVLDAAALRYWDEVGQHHACGTFTNLDRLVTSPHLKGKRLCDITDDDVTRAVAWRRGQRRWGRADLGLVSPATVNRSMTEVLQKMFTRAKYYWGARFDYEPKWGKHMLKEPDEHVRELRADEADAITLATRPDYEPFIAFARATGLRLRECLLRWSEVDWEARKITKKGKGGRVVATPITSEVAAILAPLIGHDNIWVFTYTATRTRVGRVKGRRYPITFSGAKTMWRRIRARAGGVDGFRFHDFRHDLATKVLRKTGNLKTVQKMLSHANIKTTVRYAHVLDSEVADALESVQADQKSRKNSRSDGRKAG